MRTEPMRTTRSLRSLRSAILALAACGLAIPAAAQGSVTLYEHNGYRGESLSLTGDVANLAGSVLGSDRASSVRVAPGCTATLYEHPNFRGDWTVVTADSAALVGSEVRDDRVSSVRVDCVSRGPHGVVLYTDNEYRGDQAVFYEDVRDLRPDVFRDNAASSIRVPQGCSVTLYEHPDFRGEEETLVADDPVLANNRIGGDNVSSLRVRCAVAGLPPRSPGALDQVYRCLDSDADIAILVDPTGRDRGQATLLLGGTEVADFQARLDGGRVELEPIGRADGELWIDLGRREISVADGGGALRPFCRWG